VEFASLDFYQLQQSIYFQNPAKRHLHNISMSIPSVNYAGG